MVSADSPPGGIEENQKNTSGEGSQKRGTQTEEVAWVLRRKERA